MTATVVVPTHNGRERLRRLLDSLARQTAEHEVLVVDNGSSDGTEELLRRYSDVEAIRLPANAGYSRAVNLAAERAAGEVLVLLNDDVVCEPDFVAELTAHVDAAAGTVLAAGVLLEARAPGLIDTAGMELDPTLLVFDYLNGQPVEVLDDPALAPPVGPSGAAGAVHRDAFRGVGGFDENLFAYWEDVDLVLRLRAAGATCALAARARGVHDHSATLGSGSARKNYLTGFGRGYVLRKWGAATPRRLPRAVLQDALICGGQAAVDRNLTGVGGRIQGFRRARDVRREPYPAELVGRARRPPLETLIPRVRRRARLRRRATAA